MANPDFVKGQEKKGGRTKGTSNKFTNLKKAFLDVFEKIEIESQKDDSEVKSFFEWSTKNDKNRGLFYQMISKMLPTNVKADIKMPSTFEIIFNGNGNGNGAKPKNNSKDNIPD